MSSEFRVPRSFPCVFVHLSHITKLTHLELTSRTTTRSCKLNGRGLFDIYFQGRQWICFLRMQDGLISKSAWMNTRNSRRGRFPFVDTLVTGDGG